MCRNKIEKTLQKTRNTTKIVETSRIKSSKKQFIYIQSKNKTNNQLFSKIMLVIKYTDIEC